MSQFDKIHYLLGAVVVLLVLVNIPAEVEEEIEYTVIVSKNISKTISVPYEVEEEIEVPYQEQLETIDIVEQHENLVSNFNGWTISNGHWNVWRLFLEKDDVVEFEYGSINYVYAYILSSQQYDSFKVWGETTDYMDHYFGSGANLTHTCNYDDDYYFIIQDYEPISMDSFIEFFDIDKYYTEEIITYYNVTKYKTEVLNYVAYRNETITETLYENELVTETITHKTSYLYKLLNID